MEYISFKVEKPVLKQIEKGMKEFHYNTKTDFLRDAVRTKLQELEENREKKKAWKALFAAKGKLKGKSRFKNYEEWHDWRSNKGSEELMKELSEKHKIKLD